MTEFSGWYVGFDIITYIDIFSSYFNKRKKNCLGQDLNLKSLAFLASMLIITQLKTSTDLGLNLSFVLSGSLIPAD